MLHLDAQDDDLVKGERDPTSGLRRIEAHNDVSPSALDKVAGDSSVFRHDDSPGCRGV